MLFNNLREKWRNPPNCHKHPLYSLPCSFCVTEEKFIKESNFVSEPNNDLLFKNSESNGESNLEFERR